MFFEWLGRGAYGNEGIIKLEKWALMNKTRILAYFIHNYDDDYDYDNHGNDVPNDDFHFHVSP